MNPLCILTKTRTFKDIEVRPSAYKLLAESRLPKNAATRRTPSWSVAPQPAQKTLFEPPPPQPQPIVVEKVVQPWPVEMEIVPETPAPVQPEPVALANSPFAPGAKKSEKTSARGTFKKAVQFSKSILRGLAFTSNRRPARQSTVQTELALEKVTVLRNDLNEDDLEVVLVQRTVGTAEKPLARLSKTETPTEIWNKLTTAFGKKRNENATSPKEETKPSPELSAGT
jgi:hypothetical protein